jgi:hypothetical protein
MDTLAAFERGNVFRHPPFPESRRDAWSGKLLREDRRDERWPTKLLVMSVRTFGRKPASARRPALGDLCSRSSPFRGQQPIVSRTEMLFFCEIGERHILSGSLLGER